MSYSTILEKLDQTSIDMELKRTQFHDAKSALKNAEENLTNLDKENINYKKLNFYDHLEKAKDSFEDENYEKSKEIALQSAEGSLSIIVEMDVVKSNKNDLEKLFDDALIERLQFDKKEKDEVKNSVKDIEKSIETGKISDASQKIVEQREKLETKITRKRIEKSAPLIWNELKKLNKEVEIDEYYTNEEWDSDGIIEDVKILNRRKTEEASNDGIKLDKVPPEWKELEMVDKDANVNDYRIKDRWDLDGIKADLNILRKRNPWKYDKNKTKKQDGKSQITNFIGRPIDSKKTKVRKTVRKKKKDVSNPDNKLQDLKDLKELYDEGLIDIDEFKQMKKEILGK